jgi:hypothetical protein
LGADTLKLLRLSDRVVSFLHSIFRSIFFLRWSRGWGGEWYEGAECNDCWAESVMYEIDMAFWCQEPKRFSRTVIYALLLVR